MSGHDTVQNNLDDFVPNYIENFKKLCEVDEKAKIENMRGLLENPKLMSMLRMYYETDYPQNVLDRYRPETDSLKYKYLISVDGHSAAWKRPETIMASDSVLFKTTTKYYQWFYDGLQPFVNYIPVRPDTSDMMEKLEWARSHDDVVQQIIKNANLYAEKVFAP